MSNFCSIAFIGTGVMGHSMAGHLLRAGHRLHIHNRTKAKAQSLLDAGARWHNTPGDAAAEADFIFSIVGFPADVEEVYFGHNGILARGKPGSVFVDMTTSNPKLAKRIAESAAHRKCEALDAPVSGGDVGARDATLVIMAGGSAGAFENARPLLEILGKKIVLHGGPGSGQHCKLTNQIAIASTMVAWCEALVYASKVGLDPSRVIENIGGGAAASWALSNLAPRAMKGDFSPGFYVKHFIKDLRLALESAAELKLDLPGLAQAKRLYELVAERGWSDEGIQALFKVYLEGNGMPYNKDAVVPFNASSSLSNEPKRGLLTSYEELQPPPKFTLAPRLSMGYLGESILSQRDTNKP